MKNKAIFVADERSSGEIQSSSLSSGTPENIEIAPIGAILVSCKKNGVKNGVTFKKYRAQLMAIKKPFKDPKIIRSKSGDWYIQYFYKHPDTYAWMPFKTRAGINYIKDPADKEAAADELRRQVLAWLMDGHGPFSEDRALEVDLQNAENRVFKIKAGQELWTLEKAIAEYRTYINGQGLSVDTIRAYEKYIRSFEAWIVSNDFHQDKAAQFTEMDLEVYLTESFDDNDWEPTTYNNYMTGLITFFNRAAKLEKKAKKIRGFVYDFDPDELEEKITRPQRNKAFTPLIFDRIKKEMEKPEYVNLRDYCEWIYLSLMRPKEIRALRVQDIDHVNRQIRLMGKSGDRIVPISDQLLALIQKRNILTGPLNAYVFGYAGAVDDRRRSVAYFLILFKQIADKLKLDKNYGPYSYKPTGVIKMIKAGFTDKEIMVQTGHKTEVAFAAYKRDLVIDNDSIMKGKTIDF